MAFPVCVAAQAPSPHDEVAASLLEIAGEGFRIRQTEHFTICYDTPYSALGPHVGRLEGIYDAIQRFCKANEVGVDKLDTSLPILFFDRPENFSRYAKTVDMQTDSIAGFYHQRNNVAVFLNTLNNSEVRRVSEQIAQAEGRLRGPGGTEAREAREALGRDIRVWRSQRDALVDRFNRFVLQHEAAHQVLFNRRVHARGAKNPTWLVEGLASQFEVPQSDLSGVLRGVNHMRLADLREAMGVPPAAGSRFEVDPAAVFAGGKLVAFAEFIGDDELFSRRHDDLTVLYAQSWGLVSYLHREHRESFAGYLRKLASRSPGEAVTPEREIAEFETAFGPIGPQLERRWVKFILRLRFDPQAAGR